MTINDNSTKSINAAIIDLQNQIKQLQHKIDILSKNQLKEDDIEFPGKVEYADEAGKAKEADHAKTADTAKYTSETENAVHAGYADIATKATQDASGNVITDTYATKSELTNGLSGKANTSHNHSTADITSGTLAVERGGTGQTTQAGINKAIVGELSEGNDVVTDGTMFVSSCASDNGFADTNATNVPYKRKFSRVWEYIKGKISSVLGITNNKHIIQGETVDTNTYADTNPKLVFINADGSQNASLTYTDYDLVQKPASLTLNGNQGGEYFIAPNIKATDKFYGNLSGTADNANKIVPKYTTKYIDTVGVPTIKYIKLADCMWNEAGTMVVYLKGDNFEDSLIINFGGGHALEPMLCGHYTSNNKSVRSVIAQKGSEWYGNYSIWIKILQLTTCAVSVAVLTGSCTINISETTTAPTNVINWDIDRGYWGTFTGNISSPNITALENRVAALESKVQ